MIFRNKNLLTNLRPSGAITFTGIGGSINVTQQGDFGLFGTVAYDKRATFNVLSVDSLPKTSVVTYDHAERCHTIAIDGKIGVTVRRFPYVNQYNVSHILVNTVAQNESMYTKGEVEEAKQARELYRMLAYLSYKDISEAITSGTLLTAQSPYKASVDPPTSMARQREYSKERQLTPLHRPIRSSR